MRLIENDNYTKKLVNKLNEKANIDELKALAKSLGITNIITASEHKREDEDYANNLDGLAYIRWQNIRGKGHDYYGYATITTEDFGEFMVSYNTNDRRKGNKVRSDGFPWKFLMEDPLTTEQINFVQKYNDEIYSLISNDYSVFRN